MIEPAAVSDLRMIVNEGVIVPITVNVCSEEQTDDSDVSIWCWVNHPLSIISLIGTRRQFLDADRNFFRQPRHEGRVIRCEGYVSYMILHALTISDTESCFYLRLINIQIRRGVTRINEGFRHFLQFREFSTANTRARSNDGFQEINSRLQTSRFVVDPLPEESESEEVVDKETYEETYEKAYEETYEKAYEETYEDTEDEANVQRTPHTLGFSISRNRDLQHLAFMVEN